MSSGGVTFGSGWLAAQLPPSMLEDPAAKGDPLLPRFLRIFEDTSGSVQERLDGLEHNFDVGVAPAPFVRWLGTWLGVEVDPSLPEAVQRRLVRAAGTCLARRGTVAGLEGFVREATESPCLVLDQGGVFWVGQEHRFGVEVTVHVESLGGLTDAQLQVLVDRQLPPGATAHIVVGPVPDRPPPPWELLDVPLPSRRSGAITTESAEGGRSEEGPPQP